MTNYVNGSDLDFETLERIDEKSMKLLKRSTIGLPSISPSTTRITGQTMKSKGFLNYQSDMLTTQIPEKESEDDQPER
jgi:hypothetical protein